MGNRRVAIATAILAVALVPYLALSGWHHALDYGAGLVVGACVGSSFYRLREVASGG